MTRRRLAQSVGLLTRQGGRGSSFLCFAAATAGHRRSGGSSSGDGTAAEDVPPTSTTVSTSTAAEDGKSGGAQSSRAFGELATALYSQLSYFLCAMLCISVLMDTPLTIVMWWYPTFISSTYPASDNVYSMYVRAAAARGGVVS